MLAHKTQEVAHFCDWTEGASSWLTLGVAFLAVSVAYYQWRTANSKHIFELFELRIARFSAVMAFIEKIGSSGACSSADVCALGVSTRDIQWVFDNTVAEYVQGKLADRGAKLAYLEKQLSYLPVGAARDEAAREAGVLLKWFYFEARKEFQELADPHLRLSPPDPLIRLVLRLVGHTRLKAAKLSESIKAKARA